MQVLIEVVRDASYDGSSQVQVEDGEKTKEQLSQELDLRLTSPLEAGTKPMGFPKGRSGSSSLWSNTGIQTPCSI